MDESNSIQKADLTTDEHRWTPMRVELPQYLINTGEERVIAGTPFPFLLFMTFASPAVLVPWFLGGSRELNNEATKKQSLTVTAYRFTDR